MNCTNHPDVISGVVRCGRCGKPFCQDCVVELDGRPYDAACKEEQIRDLRSGATELAYSTAGRRWAAMFIDSMVLYFVFLIIVFVAALATASDFANGLGVAGTFMFNLVLPSLIFFIYEGLMTANGGQTLGKRALGIRVVNSDGSAMESGTSWKRAGGRFFVAITVVLNLVDAIMVFSDKHRTLRDRFADTVVVRRGT